ncbi:MAG: tetratricopeptide repeat protein [Bacteroidota bacterium]
MRRLSYVIAGIYSTAAILFCRLPLFNYLGYEFSISIALLVPWLCGPSTIAGLKSSSSFINSDSGSYLRYVLSSIRRHLLLLLLPLVIITANIFFIKNCSYAEGLAFFLLLPVVTVVFSCALAGLCFVLWRRHYLMYYFFLILMLLYPLSIGWRTPQIYSYDFIYGYFPGFSYDEVIEISSRLVVFRLITLIVSVFMILLGIFFLQYGIPGSSLLKRISSPKRLFSFDPISIAIIFFGVVISICWFMKVQLGFESPVSAITKKLDNVTRTEHFRIHYAKGSFTDEEAVNLALEHEYRYQRIKGVLQTSSNDVIDSYIYPNAEVKREFIGAGSTNIAKPWRREIHINKESWEGVLEHELIHVMAGEFGMPLIKANVNIGLVEGLAMSLEEDYGNRTLHEYAAAMIQFGLIRDPGALITPSGFMLHASSVSYVLMGSFCKFLISRYGMVRFKQLYGGKSPSLVYGVTFTQLTNEWERFLERIEIPDEWENHVRYYFNRPSIFAKECARTVAKLNEAGWKSLDEQSPGNAMGIFSNSLRTSWNTEAFNGLVISSYRAAKFDTIIQIMTQRLADSSSVSNLLLYYGDALWHRGQTDSARMIYKKIASIDLSERYDEAIALRLRVLEDNTLRFVLKGYFLGISSDSSLNVLFASGKITSANPVFRYVKTKYFIRQKKYQEAIDIFQSVKPGLDNGILDASREQWIALCYFQLKKYQPARAHYWQSLNYITNRVSIHHVEEQIDRCDWYSNNSK